MSKTIVKRPRSSWAMVEAAEAKAQRALQQQVAAECSLTAYRAQERDRLVSANEAMAAALKAICGIINEVRK